MTELEKLIAKQDEDLQKNRDIVAEIDRKIEILCPGLIKH